MGFTFLFSNWYVTLHAVHFQSGLSFEKQGVSGWWAMFLSNFGITNWMDVSVFYSFVEHSKIQHLHIFLGYPVLLAFFYFMCNAQKMTKCQTSALGNAFIAHLRYFLFVCFLLFFFPLRRQYFLTISDFCSPCSHSAYEKKIPTVTAKVTLNHSGFLYLVHVWWKILFQKIFSLS